MLFIKEQKKALDEILLSMKSVRDNLETEAADDAVKANAEAMLVLAEAYKRIISGK